jgi:hypothetical protein
VVAVEIRDPRQFELSNEGLGFLTTPQTGQAKSVCTQVYRSVRALGRANGVTSSPERGYAHACLARVSFPEPPSLTQIVMVDIVGLNEPLSRRQP